MNELWLDLGNTRLKYWVSNPQGQIIEHTAELHLQSPADLLLGLLTHFKYLNLKHIGISSVLDQHTNQRIEHILQQLNIPIYFAHVQAQFAHLTSHYHPQQLGIDRWLQVLAMTRQPAQYCIIGCGTALTIDLLDRHQHLGGYILPSLYLQRDSLTQGTKGIKIPDQAFEHLKAGCNTGDAVHHGILLGLLGAIHYTLQQYPHYQLILTGGDAAIFARHLSHFHPMIEPDLLLIGLQQYVKIIK